MKIFYKTIIIIAMFVMPAMAFASMAKPSDLDDTIPATPRCDKYYYTKWFDDCPNWRPNGVWDSCFCFKYHITRYVEGAKIAKWEYAHNGRMKVKGLVAMVQNYNPPTVDTAANVQKLPEYLYLYQMTETGRNIQGIDIEVRLQLLDSVRWDTATARVMEFRQGWNDEYVQYCYLYEAYFEQPVWVDTEFFIAGSTNSGYNSVNSNGRIPTVYVDIMDQQDYMLDNKTGCDISNYHDLIGSDGPLFQDQFSCQLPGRPYAFWASTFSTVTNYWMSDWPYSPVGYYLVIVDKWDLNAEPNEAGWGEVLGGGRFPDESDDTITAIAAPGFAFVSWSDGVTDNPRVVHLMSDTTLIANFQCTQQFNLQATSSDDAMGTVSGGGTYYASDVTISASPNIGHRFLHWNDGSTETTRIIHLVSDTAFVAYFQDISSQMFNLQVSSANVTMGNVTGGGSYSGGTYHTITANPFENRFRFTHWSCGTDSITANPLTIYLISDTAFVAHFVELPEYNVQTAVNNNEWGTVEGGGVFVEGDEATLTVVPTMFCRFQGWSDGETDMPRIVTVTQDTLFTAILYFDSAWAEGISIAGNLDFSVSPNPTTGRLSIRINQAEEYEMTIFDMNGKKLIGKKCNDAAAEVDISTLPAGQYMLLLRTKDKYGIKTIVKK